jgi:hypothetical protein
LLRLLVDGLPGLDGSPNTVPTRKEIEQVRKGDFEVSFQTADGTPVSGTAEIRHVHHAFLFGAPFSTGEAFLDLHNLGRMNPHWRNLQTHFSATDRSTITMDRINAGLEQFARCGKEMVITEYDPPTVMRDRTDLYKYRLIGSAGNALPHEL